MEKFFRKKIASILIFAFSFLAFADLRYREVSEISGGTIVAVEKIEEFESIIKENAVKEGLFLSPKVFISLKGTLYSFDLVGFKTIDDYKQGMEKGFEKGNEWYEAKKLKSKDATLYHFYKANNFKQVKDCEDAYKNGFEYAVKKMQYFHLSTNASSDSDVYYEAKEKGYKNFDEWKEYLTWTSQGYKSKADYDSATEKGFTRRYEYYDAVSKGFNNYAEYRFAQGMGLGAKNELDTYKNIVFSVEKIIARFVLEEKNINRHTAFVYFLLEKVSEKELSLSKLSEKLNLFCDEFSEELLRKLSDYISYSFIDGYHTISNTEWNFLLNSTWYDAWEKRYEMRTDSGTGVSYAPRRNGSGIRELLNEPSLDAFFKMIDISALGTYDSNTEIFRCL